MLRTVPGEILLGDGGSVVCGLRCGAANLLDQQQHLFFDQVRAVNLNVVRAASRDDSPAAS